MGGVGNKHHKNRGSKPEVSIIVPVYNEEECLPIFYHAMKKAMKTLTDEYELIMVDDGSTDNSKMIIESLGKRDRHIKPVFFKKNKGQSFAMGEGFNQAKGDIIVTLDADMQNDPADIPTIVKELRNSGKDVVCGWRFNRRDSYLIKLLPSKIFNKILYVLFKLSIHDSSCTLRAYDKKVVKDIAIFDGCHRLIPIILAKRGYNICESKVNHKKRYAGKAKYDSPKRLLTGLLDVLKVKFFL